MSNRSNTELWTSRLIWTAVVGNLRPIVNRPDYEFGILEGGLPIRRRLPTCPTLLAKLYFGNAKTSDRSAAAGPVHNARRGENSS